MKSLGRNSADWFVEFTAAFCKQACLDVGERIQIAFCLADSTVPQELEVFISESEWLAAMWNNLSRREQREACEHIRVAKKPETRERRAARIVGKLEGHPHS